MCISMEDKTSLLISDDEQRIELILDLTRRIQLLEDLMSAARTKRRIADDGISTALTHVAINRMNTQ